MRSALPGLAWAGAAIAAAGSACAQELVWTRTVGTTVSDEAKRQFAAGLYPHVAILGTPEEVDIVVAQFRSSRGDGRVLLDELAPSQLPTRVLILEVPA